MDRNDGFVHNAVEKTKEVMHDVKDKVSETYDKMTGNYTTEEKAANKVKEGADSCAKMMKDARETASNKMHEGANYIEGH